MHPELFKLRVKDESRGGYKEEGTQKCFFTKIKNPELKTLE